MKWGTPPQFLTLPPPGSAFKAREVFFARRGRGPPGLFAYGAGPRGCCSPMCMRCSSALFAYGEGPRRGDLHSGLHCLIHMH